MTSDRAGGLERAIDRLASGWRTPLIAVPVILLPMLALVTFSPPVDPDVFARTAVGRLIEVNGTVVDRDPFAYTALKDRWIDHEWLSGVVFYRVAKLGGDGGLLAFNLLAMVLTVGIVAAAQRRLHGGRSWSPPWLFLTLVPAFGVWISVVRSRVFTFLGLAVLLLCLVQWREGRGRWLALVPVVFVPWANAHGGFVAGLGLLGAACVGATLQAPRRAWPLWLCLALSVGATLVNPYGTEYWSYLTDAVTMTRPGIAEWGPLPPGSLLGVWLIGLVGVFLLGSLTERGRPTPEGVAMVAAAFVAALGSKRIAYFALVVLAVYGAGPAVAMASAIRERAPTWWAAGGRVMTTVLMALAALSAVRVVGNLSSVGREGLDYSRFPTGAVEWLRAEGLGGRILVHFNVGSFALWRLYPEYRVSVDGRYEETYPQATVDKVYRALLPGHPDHTASLRAVAPDYILVQDRDGGPTFGPEWNPVFRDGTFVVFAHDTLSHGLAAPRPPRPMWTPGF